MAFQNINLTTLLGLLQSRLDSYTFWSSAEQTDALNEGLRVYQLATGRWKDRFVFPTVAKRAIYDLTQVASLYAGGKTKILAPFRIVFGTGPQPLAWTNFADLDFTYPGWQATNTTTPGAPNVPIMGGLFGGLNMIFIYPADFVGGNSLQVDCLLTTPVLVKAADYVNLDTSEIQCLLGYAAHVLSFKQGGILFQQTMPGYFAFLKMLADRNGQLKVLSPFKEALGQDAARRMVPRRMTDQTGLPETIGIR